MSVDHAVHNETKRDALFRLLSDREWHPHYEIARVAGVRYSARILELKRLGYVVEALDSHGDQGRLYRMPTLAAGTAQPKRVKVFLEERDVGSLLDGHVTPRARAALEDARASFQSNRERL